LVGKIYDGEIIALSGEVGRLIQIFKAIEPVGIKVLIEHPTSPLRDNQIPTS
jgi:hypothetical protein